MGRPYRFSLAHARGRPAPNLAVVDLSGQWRANVADDERRRSAVGLDYLDDDWPEIEVPSHWRNLEPFADNDDALIYRKRFDLDAAAAGQAPFRHPRRRVLPGRRVARRRVPRRSGGLLLPAQLRHHQPLAPGHRARAGGRGGLPAAAEPEGEANHHRRVPELGRAWTRRGTRAVSGAPCGSRPPARCESTVGASCAATSTTPAPTFGFTPGSTATRRERCGSARASTASLLEQHEQSLAGGLNEVDWNLDINDPRLWWPWSLGDQELTDVEVEIFVDEDDQRFAHRAHRACARWCCRTGCSRSTASRCSSRAPTWRRPEWRWATPRQPSSGAMSSWRATPASTCCGFTATSRVPSCTTPPTSSACCCGRTSRCSGGTPAPSARRPCARPAKRSTSSAIIRRSRCGARTTSRWRRTSIERRRSARRHSSTSPGSSCRRGTRPSSIGG